MIQYDSLANEGYRWDWGEPTSGYMLSSHFLSNPKPQTGNTPRKLLFQEKKKRNKILVGGKTTY